MNYIKKAVVSIGGLAFIFSTTMLMWRTSVMNDIVILFVCIMSGIGIAATGWSYYMFFQDYNEIKSNRDKILGYFPTMYLYILATNRGE